MKDLVTIIGGFGLFISVVCAYLTHLVWSISLLVQASGMIAAGKAVLAVLGVFFPPIGVIHGFMVWFGVGG